MNSEILILEFHHHFTEILILHKKYIHSFKLWYTQKQKFNYTLGAQGIKKCTR